MEKILNINSSFFITKTDRKYLFHEVYCTKKTLKKPGLSQDLTEKFGFVKMRKVGFPTILARKAIALSSVKFGGEESPNTSLVTA